MASIRLKFGLLGLLSSLFFCVWLAGCTDAYKTTLPPNGLLTVGEIEKISAKLDGPDQEIFKRWSARIAQRNEFGGEATAPTVRAALLNQAEFEVRQRKELAEADALKAEEAKVAKTLEQERQRKQDQIDQMGNERQLVNNEIQTIFTAKAVGYEFRPLTNNYGVEVGREWVFKLNLQNRSAKSIVGASGWVTIKDVFETELGSFPIRIEPKVERGKTIDFFTVMTHNRNDPSHIAMTRAGTLKVYWFFNSVAFSDGSVMDRTTVQNNTNNGITPAKSITQKSPST